MFRYQNSKEWQMSKPIKNTNYAQESFPAEMWDKMQHIMENYNDHMVHVSIKFDGEIDVEKMKLAFKTVVDGIPVLRSVYVQTFAKAEWITLENFEIDDVFSVKEVDGNADYESEMFLVQRIRENREAQFKVQILKCEGKDTLNILMNHMCLDGADFKEFIYKVAGIYSDLVNGIERKYHIKNGSRSHMQVYENMTEGEKEEAMGLISYSKKQKAKISYPYEKVSRKKTHPRFISYKLDAETFEKIKANGKMLGVSVNDIILGCFYRATVKLCTIKEGEALGIPNMVDLRRYTKTGKTGGFCNLTSMVVANLGTNIGSDVFETILKAKISMDELKGHYPGLHGLPLLSKVFQYAPYRIAHFLIGTFFKNPLIGISNIGLFDENRLQFAGREVVDVYMTGSIKHAPYMQLSLSTFRNEVTHIVASYVTDKDYEMFETMFKHYDSELREFANLELTHEGIAKSLLLLLHNANIN